MKWFKRLLVLAACVLAMLLVVLACSYYMLRGEPEWYTRPPMSKEMREEAVARAETQFSRIEELAGSLRAYEERRQKAIRQGTTVPADALPKPVTVVLTEDELNAVFQTFAGTRGWDRELRPYLQEPKVVLQKDRVILGGKLKEVSVVASAYFSTAIDDNGMFRLELVRVLGGKLPLPDVIFDKYRQAMVKDLTGRLPGLQRSAEIDSRGVPNDSTVQASIAKLLLQAIAKEPSEPVFFLPLLTAKGTVPVRLTNVIVTDKQIQMTIAPMSEAERVEMLKRLKAPYSPTHDVSQ